MFPSLQCGDDVFVSSKHSPLSVTQIVLWIWFRRKYGDFWNPLYDSLYDAVIIEASALCKIWPAEALWCISYVICIYQNSALSLHWLVDIHIKRFLNCVATAHMIKDPAIYREGPLWLGKGGCLMVFCPMSIYPCPINIEHYCGRSSAPPPPPHTHTHTHHHHTHPQ